MLLVDEADRKKVKLDLRDSNVFGDVIVACAHNINFLFRYGIIKTDQPINSIVYDEVDVYYNYQTMDDFHKLFFKYDNIANCNNLILCSATLDSEFLDKQDSMLSSKRISIQLAHMNP